MPRASGCASRATPSSRSRSTSKRARAKLRFVRRRAKCRTPMRWPLASRTSLWPPSTRCALLVAHDSSRFNSINSFQLQINQADSTKISVEESLHAKHGPLALARSRLQIRTSRPAQEQVRVAPCFIRFRGCVTISFHESHFRRRFVPGLKFHSPAGPRRRRDQSRARNFRD